MQAAPPPPPSGKSGAAKALWAAFAVALVLVGAAGGGVYWWRWANGAAGKPGAPTVRVTVAKGAAPASVGAVLEEKGVIRSARAFAYRAEGETIKPGVYDLSPGDTPIRLLARLIKGDVATNRVTFPEGFTLVKIAKRLAAKDLVKEAVFLDLAARHGDTFKASVPLPPNLEGYLFPDTYKFPVGADERAIIQRMAEEFDRRVTTGKADALRQSGRSLSDIVIIASLIEREAETDGDRPRIAGVIYNRLRRKMPLQIDATVQYARGQHKARLLFADLKIDSPYNTYKVRGLPPGAICCPGLPSLNAALAPDRSDYLFYVARPDGSHIFSRTFAEHNRNIALVRRGGVR